MQNYKNFNISKSQCNACIIGKCYNKVVCSDGNNIDPIVMVVGECPGNDEVEQGKPFIGKAGKLLRPTLEKYNINCNNSIITNTMPCRPEKNKFPKDDKLVRECVEKWLFNEIRILKPSIILLVGSTPLKFVLGMKGITSLRGKLFDFKLDNDTFKCVACYHPSYVLRKKYMKEGPQIILDFEKDIEFVAKTVNLI